MRCAWEKKKSIKATKIEMLIETMEKKKDKCGVAECVCEYMYVCEASSTISGTSRPKRLVGVCVPSSLPLSFLPPSLRLLLENKNKIKIKIKSQYLRAFFFLLKGSSLSHLKSQLKIEAWKTID